MPTHTFFHSSVPRLNSQGFLERLGDEVIAGVELIRAKALALVGMGGGATSSSSSSRSGFEEKQGYYDAGADLEASGSAVSSKGASSTIKRFSSVAQRHNEFIPFFLTYGVKD